jgi:hypothetical protein
MGQRTTLLLCCGREFAAGELRHAGLQSGGRLLIVRGIQNIENCGCPCSDSEATTDATA